WITDPPCVMTTPAWMSSPGSMARAPSVTMWSSSVVMLRAYAAEAAVGMVAGRLLAPTTVTPFPVTTVSPGTDPATFPPSGPEPVGRPDGLQARYAGAQHQDLRRPCGAGCGDEHGEEPAERGGRHQRRLVAGDVRL